MSIYGKAGWDGTTGFLNTGSDTGAANGLNPGGFLGLAAMMPRRVGPRYAEDDAGLKQVAALNSLAPQQQQALRQPQQEVALATTKPQAEEEHGIPMFVKQNSGFNNMGIVKALPGEPGASFVGYAPKGYNPYPGSSTMSGGGGGVGEDTTVRRMSAASPSESAAANAAAGLSGGGVAGFNPYATGPGSMRDRVLSGGLQQIEDPLERAKRQREALGSGMPDFGDVSSGTSRG